MFKNDYSEIAHINILNALIKANNEQNIGYGLDVHTMNACKKIKEVFGAPKADVHLLTGGTQTNMTVISHILRPYEGVICCESGHINVHETAAVEGSGHKVYAVKSDDGKVKPTDIEKAMKLCHDEHMVKLSMVYISDSTEIGGIYTLAELKALRAMCDKYNLYLFMDGARLAVALTASGNDIKPTDLGKYCDVFYVGGTKNGLTSGEAVVIVNDKIKEDFRYHIKNKGAMLAKGYVLGIEFEEAFTNDLYFEMAKNSNQCAMYIKDELSKAKIEFTSDSVTNQQFIKLPKAKAIKVIDKFGCELWEDLDTSYVIRIVTSFKTTRAECEELVKFIKEL